MLGLSGRSSLLLVAAIVVSFLAGLGAYPLTERSEARYAGVSWEMLRSGDYLTPHFNGIKHFHKPPLFYWMCAASMAALGDSEAAARLPCALAALATLAVVGWWAARPEAQCSRPWLAPACLAASPFFWEMGRVAVTDMVVTLLVVMALAAAWKMMTDGPTRLSLVVFWTSLGLGFLNKGPVAPLIVAMVLLPCFRGGRTSWRAFSPLPGLALATAIALPWYLWVVFENPGLLGYFLKFQTVDRVFSTVHERTGPPWFYLPVLLGGFLPWTCWLPGCLRQALRQARDTERTGPNLDLFLLSWLIWPALFFSLIGSKLPPYVLPLFPALALLVARHLHVLSARVLKAPLLVLVVTSLACIAQARWGLLPRLLVFLPELRWAAGWLLLVVLGAVVFRHRKDTALVAPVVAMLGLTLLIVPGLGKLARNSARPMVEAMRRTASGPFEVAVYGGYLFGLPYYLDDYVTHVAFAREVQFETDLGYRRRIFPDLPAYLPTFQKGDRDRFLVIPRPLSPSARLGEPIIFSDERWIVVYHRRDGSAP